MSIVSSLSTNYLNLLNSTIGMESTSSSSIIRSMPIIKALPVALVLSSIVVLCICGNILVILSVFTFRPLRTVQNFFIVSLAFSDMLVAIMVMPFHIVTHILKRWVFGQILCQVFVTSDILLCTSSILNLCAIALDRYWAISDPIQYARQRTIRRVLAMIIIVWILSATISIPPIIASALGSETLRTFNDLQQCELPNNKYYVIYSACGSFYIPALIMTIVYAQVFIETRKRFRERAKAATKLANATRTQRNIKTTNNLKGYHPKQSIVSTILHPTNSSFKYSASNGSGLENFSSDDAEEALYTKTESYDTTPGNIEVPIGLYNQPSIREFRSENGCFNQQHVSVQTTELLTKSKFFPMKRSSKDHNYKILFKGKSLATLMHERQKISLTRERRLSRTLGIIISVFLLCWLPFFVVYILAAFIEVSEYIKEPIPTFILWLGYINSAVNPLIYTVFNVEFRTAFKRLLFRRINRNSIIKRNRK